MRERDSPSALSLVLRSVEAVRNARALYVLVGTFAMAGLRVAGAESSLAPGRRLVGTGAGRRRAFLVMDGARGVGIREVPDAPRTSFFTSHGLLLALLLLLAAYAPVAAVPIGVLT